MRDNTAEMIDRSIPQAERQWLHEAIGKISADMTRSADTHLIELDLPCLEGVDLYLKDESTHPSGSLKHRLARSLFLYGLCNGDIRKGCPVVEASSGSTAISEAYFARVLGLPFVAIVPHGIARRKIDQITFYGGECKLVDPERIYDEAQQTAHMLGGHYMDQFTFAERATDWRGNNNIAESLFNQMSQERHPVPAWVVVGAGTGGTSATIGRYIRYRPEYRLQTRLCVVDPENSVFLDYFATGDASICSRRGSRIEGIGRPRVEPSFIRTAVDRMMRVSDAASIATIWWLEKLLGRKCGGSTGTALYGALTIAAEMAERGEAGSVVTIIGDAGERYLDTYYDKDWLEREGLALGLHLEQLQRFEKRGRFQQGLSRS